MIPAEYKKPKTVKHRISSSHWAKQHLCPMNVTSEEQHLSVESLLRAGSLFGLCPGGAPGLHYAGHTCPWLRREIISIFQNFCYKDTPKEVSWNKEGSLCCTGMQKYEKNMKLCLPIIKIVGNSWEGASTVCL